MYFRKFVYILADCRVIPGAGLTTPHRLLILDFVLTSRKKRKNNKTQPMIRRWRLSETKAQTMRERILEEAENKGAWQIEDNTELMWGRMAECIHQVAREVLGVSRGNTVHSRGEAWWNDKVQSKVKTKQVVYRSVLNNTSEDARVHRVAEYKRARERQG